MNWHYRKGGNYCCAITGFSRQCWIWILKVRKVLNGSNLTLRLLTWCLLKLNIEGEKNLKQEASNESYIVYHLQLSVGCVFWCRSSQHLTCYTRYTQSITSISRKQVLKSMITGFSLWLYSLCVVSYWLFISQIIVCIVVPYFDPCSHIRTVT